MICPNLIPPERRHAKRRAMRVRRWMAAVIAYGGALVGLVAGAYALFGVGGPDYSTRYARQRSEVTETYQHVRTLAAELVEVRAELAASRSVGRQPDWSVLLALVSKVQGERIVLRRVLLAPAGEPAPGQLPAPLTTSAEQASDPATGDYVLELSGVGLNQEEVSRFALRLEGLGLFETVRPLRTAPEQFLARDATAFQIRCLLNQAAPEPAEVRR